MRPRWEGLQFQTGWSRKASWKGTFEEGSEGEESSLRPTMSGFIKEARGAWIE